MNLIKQAEQLYNDHNPEHSFRDALSHCLNNGLVVSKPDFLLLAEPCFSDGKRIIRYGWDKANCWHVQYCGSTRGSNPIKDCMKEASFVPMYAAFRRRCKDKIYKWSRLPRD